jgi:hypothetical protein
VRVRRDYWLVIDIFHGDRPHDVSLSYPLAAGLHVVANDVHAVAADAHGDVARFLAAEGNGAWQVVEAWTSTAYGRRERAVRLLQRFTFCGEFVATTLVQAADAVPFTAVRVAHDDGATWITVEGGDGGLEACRLGWETGTFVDRAGHRTVWTWPVLAAGVPRKEAR